MIARFIDRSVINLSRRIERVRLIVLFIGLCCLFGEAYSNVCTEFPINATSLIFVCPTKGCWDGTMRLINANDTDVGLPLSCDTMPLVNWTFAINDLNDGDTYFCLDGEIQYNPNTILCRFNGSSKGDDKKTSDIKSLSPGEIASIVVCLLLAIAMAAFGGVLYGRRRAKRAQQEFAMRLTEIANQKKRKPLSLSDFVGEDDDDLVPPYLRRRVEILDASGYQLGIYREGATDDIIALFDQAMEHKPTIVFRDLDPRITPCAMAVSIKRFLRSITPSLIPSSLCPKIKEAMSVANKSDQMVRIRQLLLELSPVHTSTLRFLLHHIRRVVDAAYITSMDAYNLAVVIAPSIIIPDEGGAHVQVENKEIYVPFVVLLIDYSELLEVRS